MTMQAYEISSNIEWDSPPDAFYTDVEFYQEKANEVSQKLIEINMNYAVAWWYGAPAGSEFLVEDEGTEETPYVDDDGTYYRVAKDDDFEVRWEGPHLKIHSDGAIQLFWDAKHSNERCWCDLK